MGKTDNLRQIEELIGRAQKGEVEAFGKVYDLLVDRIYRFVLFKTGDVMVAQDITSETFMRGWRHLNKVEHRNFRAYLFKIARNLVVDHYQQRKRTVRLPEGDWLADPKVNVERGFIKKQAIEELYKALSKLPKNYLEVVSLRFLEGLSVKETAAIIGKSSSAVRVIQHRAIKKLKGYLKK